ncbi:Protein GrpE (HSP-70 cofactor) [Paracholeplasma brassicae]|uniref:Protein GrpE n=1 Tax=Acholeplasma brassicae TaxID=61635 RepID=U4KN49_9MOLU|nr:nucleotide exchange factor GrpE [Paracholeplasma brassicae]CCV65727.1 Protein GrpE (HSP-70 cofactor) [Paracholeplasma brassicae]
MDKEKEVVVETTEELNEADQKNDYKEKKKSEKNKYKEEIEQLKEENKELKEKYLRQLAELENFKKRVQQERVNERKYASQNLVESLLPSIDQLRLVVNMPTDNELLKNYLIGFKMINDQIFNTLESDGLKEVNALDKQFDPNFHHAIDKVSDKDKPNGVVVSVTQTGYTYKERLIRPAMVKVNEWSDENGNDK